MPCFSPGSFIYNNKVKNYYFAHRYLVKYLLNVTLLLLLKADYYLQLYLTIHGFVGSGAFSMAGSGSSMKSGWAVGAEWSPLEDYGRL